MTFYEAMPKVLEWDTRHFGVRIARYGPRKPDAVLRGVAWARRQGVEMLMARCHASDMVVLHALESAGFLHMDTFLRFSLNVATATVVGGPGGTEVRPARPSDEIAIGRLARRAFRGLGGHFHSDPRLSPASCDALYAEWAVNSCRQRHLADVVLVAEDSGRLKGFITLKRLRPGTAEGVLFAVDPAARGRGIGRHLMLAAIAWCQEQKVRELQMETHVHNFAAQAVWRRLGFDAYAAGHTLHLWLEPRSKPKETRR